MKKIYEDKKNICGIYFILNRINQKGYVGQSISIGDRWQTHLTHYCNPNSNDYHKVLYQAFRKYGIENFSFSILEECSREELSQKELAWIEKKNSFYHGYNCSLTLQPYPMDGELHFNARLTEKDVKEIRTSYANRERCKEVFLKYADRISWTGFHKIWKGETWKKVMMEVYTPENKNFHLHNTGQKGIANGRSVLTESQVYDIRKSKLEGASKQKIFNDYSFTGISKYAFDKVWRGVSWKHVVVK